MDGMGKGTTIFKIVATISIAKIPTAQGFVILQLGIYKSLKLIHDGSMGRVGYILPINEWLMFMGSISREIYRFSHG